MSNHGKIGPRGTETYTLSAELIRVLRAQMTADIASTHNVELLSRLSLKEREEFALRTGTMVLYLGDEVLQVLAAEENAVLLAAPCGYSLQDLIGLNIGCGNRTISPYLLPVDIMRTNIHGVDKGEHSGLAGSALLSLSDDLPFRSGTVDLIVALHMLEHVANPVETINHWLDIIKPGGGIGIVLPDWRYTWDSRADGAAFSHKWNPTPRLIEMMYWKHWSQRANLEHLCSYDMRLSFDFVLRKHGEFLPFAAPPIASLKSGKQLADEGLFIDESSFR